MSEPLNISINDAVNLGIERLRMSKWANPMDHIKIDIVGGELGPWVHLYAPFNLRCNGKDPMPMIITMFNCDDRAFEVYKGPLPDSAEYRADVAKFENPPSSPQHGG